MKIGFIGLGIMGESMCLNIIKKHDDTVYVYDCIKEKVDKLSAAGGVACNSTCELAKNSDVIITMVPKSEHSMAVYKEILGQLNETKICIDMSTIDPCVSIDISFMVKETGAAFLDAPVVKSKPAAVAGTLGIYVGGEEQTCKKVEPILYYMGENVIRMGENGKGLVMKICHNALVSQIQNGVNETVVLASKNGIDMTSFSKAISYGGGQNFYLDSKKDAIQKEDFTTAFSVDNMAKDIHICSKLARQCKVSMPGLMNVERVYDQAVLDGLGTKDFSATIKIVQKSLE